MSDSKSEDLWNPYRDLYETVNKCLTDENRNPAIYNEFENVLRRNKQSFFSLINNLPKNAKSREELKKGMEEGISVKGIGHQVLSKELYQETIIISDMFDLNEYVALDLLCTAQIQMPYYPDLPRGLVAIALYYDGRKYLVSTLRMLIQARSGISWCINMPKQTQVFIDNMMDQLFENGLFNKIFDLLNKLDLTKEIDMLQSNLALGGPKHRKQITDTYTSIRVILADCIFLWSRQTGLNKQTTVTLINHLKNVKLEEEASGKLDKVNLYLIMALLNAIDLSILHSREDGEELVKKLPILSETDYINTILNELMPNKSKWACEGLQAVAVFAFAVCLSSLRLVPQGQQLQNAIDYEDEFVDSAIVSKVFEFICHTIMENDLFYEEEMIYRRMHFLFCDFIVQMYPKVKELRIKADETARTIQAYVHEGMELPGIIPRYFENLLLAIAKMYGKDPHNLKLMLEYWCPTDSTQNQSHYRAHPRSVSLFKFVRLAGDMLPPSLFVSYLTMLTSLSNCQQAARNCFNMLKQTSGFNNNFTWDHFFMSFNQYYSNLKQDAPSGNDTVYRHSRMYHKGITPQEIEGLHAVLMLMKEVATHDDFSRLALCEHPGWAPLSVLLGLISCSIPIPLKADLLAVLAALCKSPEIASQMWNNLEASQILVTIPTTSSYQPRGIQTELDEVESRIEEYPLTRAWLVLMDVLTDSGIPRTLGAGPRQPGFDPYLTFMINSVFLKFNSRSYKNQTEKWQVAALCLKLFSKFLSQYEPAAGDFPNVSKPNECNSPPGFHLMLQLHTKSELLNALLYIINEGNRLYDMCISFPGEKHIGEATLYVFKIIERSLILQPTFFQLLTTSNYNVLLVNMNKLLLTINPRSGRPDHILNIMKYLRYQDCVPAQSLLAVKILILLTSSALTHTQIMNILLSNTDLDKTIRNGFVDCLDQTTDEENEAIALTKKSILCLLKQCLNYNSPNLSHFLLGFDLQKNVSKTQFQLPGVMKFPRTCIHSLLTILRQTVYNGYESDTALVESAYHMIYCLCSNTKTADPVLRFLRTQPNFFKDHINYCVRHYNEGIHQLNQLSWILKTLAIELRIACCTKQIVHLKQLTTLLVGLPNDQIMQSDSYSLIQKVNESSMSNYSMSIDRLKHDNFLVKLIKDFDFNVPEVIAPQWGFFEHNSLENYLASCQTEGSPKLIDIKRLHRNLIEEITSAQGSTALGQRQAMIDEIQKVLLHAVNINNNRKTAVGIAKFVDGWRQVVQVLITYLPNEIISAKEQVLLQLYLLENILQKAVKVMLLPEVAKYLSSTVALLLDNLRKCHIREEKIDNALSKDFEKDTHKSMLELNISSMKGIISYIIEWIIVSDSKSQKLRINLYGALAIFLQLINLAENKSESNVDDSMYVSRLDSSKYRIQDEITSIHVTSSILTVFTDKLIEVLCYDCTGGHDICKMLAMSCFGLLIGLNGNVSWISYAAGRGYLKHIVDGILKSDSDLRATLEPSPENIKAIYIYEAKMSFLLRIATTRVGSELLLEQKLLSVFASMKVFDFHPELSKHLQTDESEIFALPVETRYLQIWEPTLHLCNAILTSLGTENKTAVVQIMNFMLSHLDVIELVLRSGNCYLSLEGLKELSLLTSIIARTANNDLVNVMDIMDTPQDNSAHLLRIQKLMLNLIPKFVLSENNLRELLCDPSNEQVTYQTSERLSRALEINGNLQIYSRSIIKNHGIDHGSVGVVFQPNLNDALVGLNGNQRNKKYVDHVPSLGVVVHNLLNTVSYYHKEKATLNFLMRKRTEIPELGTVDLKEYAPQHSYDISMLREEALQSIVERLNMKKHDIDHCSLIIEHGLYIIWAHLDYYMLRAIPKANNYGLHISSSFNMDSTLASASEAVWKVSTDDISNLKQGLVSIFNDSFCRQLIETSRGRSESDIGLLEVLLRKIKRLIQFVPVK
ncbi:PREDICTED: nuclear pore complex protein Nup205 [Nicrophorus vespilloides]|uniref:Nuclear pore complex protein Nup205 n=1 Tax=Nicrophorus vespilloides TaxID=110193 RepID=A0ABM1NHH9_NICVS|nr:PREDICTED: nuclear pore complex protein Nup205 [Nicrophorus vespilloides]